MKVSQNGHIKKKQLFDLATCRFIREGRDVLLLGPPGVGKSYLAQAIGYEAIKQGMAVLYRSIFDVVRDFLHEESMNGDDKLLARYLKPVDRGRHGHEAAAAEERGGAVRDRHASL